MARVTGSVWAARRHPTTDGIPFLWVQPVDVGDDGTTLQDHGHALAAADCVGAGPGDVITYVTAREAVFALRTLDPPAGAGGKAPVDAAITGILDPSELPGA